MLATFEQFTERHPVPSEDEDRVEALLSDASDLILDEIPDSDQEWVTTYGEDDAEEAPRSVAAVCIASAYRAYTNPDGLASVGLGAASYRFRNDGPDALYLTEREIRTIRRAGKRSSATSVTVATPYSGEETSRLDFDPDVL